MDPNQLLAMLKSRGLQAGRSVGAFHDRLSSGLVPVMMGHVVYDKYAPKSLPRMPGMPSPDSVEAGQLPYYMMGPQGSMLSSIMPTMIRPDEQAYFNQNRRLPTQAEKQLNDESWSKLQQASQVRLSQLLDVMKAGRKSGMTTKEIEALVKMAKKNSPNTPGDYIRGSGRYLPSASNNAVYNTMNLEQNVPNRTQERY